MHHALNFELLTYRNLSLISLTVQHKCFLGGHRKKQKEAQANVFVLTEAGTFSTGLQLCQSKQYFAWTMIYFNQCYHYYRLKLYKLALLACITKTKTYYQVNPLDPEIKATLNSTSIFICFPIECISTSTGTHGEMSSL